jgi:hypothetical protein
VQKVGLKINANKTKYVKCSRHATSQQTIEIGEMEIENVHSFRYLGVMVNTSNSVEEEIKKRITTRNKTYYVYKAVFGSRALSRSSELRLYNSVVRPVVIYAHEAWVLEK